jgi:predicted membrane protein
MFDNNIVFSFILAIANTFMYYMFNTSKYENNINSNRNQELIMVFGISFAMCFFMKSVSSSTTSSSNITEAPLVQEVFSQHTRPPF